MNQKYLAAQKQEIKKEIYAFIVHYFMEHGYAPANKEIAESVMVSTHTVERHVAEMMEEGLLATDHPGTSRAYRVTKFEFRRKRVKRSE